MRAIFVGIEYAGKTTLIEALDEYYHHFKIQSHLDDHFTIPDSTLSRSSRAKAVDFPDDVKERMQRMQIHYHIDVIKKFDPVLVAGWHIEEAVYTAMYGQDPQSPYYQGYRYDFQRMYEAKLLALDLPGLILVHLTASDQTIWQRIRDQPHEYQIVREADIAELKRRFCEEIDKSLFPPAKTIVLDTTDKMPQQSLDELLARSEPMISQAELAIRAMPVPDGDYEVVYEKGVRKMIAPSQ